MDCAAEAEGGVDPMVERGVSSVFCVRGKQTSGVECWSYFGRFSYMVLALL